MTLVTLPNYSIKSTTFGVVGCKAQLKPNPYNIVLYFYPTNTYSILLSVHKHIYKRTCMDWKIGVSVNNAIST